MSEESRCFAPQQPNRWGAMEEQYGNGNGRIDGGGRNEMVQWGMEHHVGTFTLCGAGPDLKKRSQQSSKRG